MIEFVSLFLGLVTGVYPVEVSVADPVAAVEIFLDGRPAGTLEGEPWKLDCDFGAALLPHELLAVARGGEGEELGRVRQWLNVPRPRAEARFTFLERDVVGLTWQALDFDRPRRVNLFFDGAPLEARVPERIALPDHDRQIHFLRAELQFSDAVEAQAELVFGGRFGEQVTSELTAVPVVSRRRGVPKPKAMDGWLETRGGPRDAGPRPLRVAAVERAPANLVVVRELAGSNLGALKGLAGVRRTHSGSMVEVPVGMRPFDRLRFVYPAAGARERPETKALLLMKSSRDVAGIGDGTLLTALTAAFDKQLEIPAPAQRLADAVAVAGLNAAAGDRPRAVLLIATGESRDTSQLSAAAARAYLRAIRVPLVVWNPSPGRTDRLAAWGEIEEVSSLQRMAEAIGKLRQALDSQLMVWVEGGHLPNRVEVTGKARGVRLAG